MIPATLRTPIALTLLALAVGVPSVAKAYQQYHVPPHRSVPIDDARDFRELERLAMGEVPYIKKMEVRDLLLKVDGFNEQGMKVKVYMDRRTGNVLSREIKYDKHGPFGKHGWRYFQGAHGGYPAPGMQHAPARDPGGGVPPVQLP